MLLNKHSFDLPTRFAGRNDARYILNGVYVTPTHVAGTDGNMLCLLTHQQEHKVGYFPACGQSDTLEEITPCVVDADSWAKVGKAIPKQKRHCGSVPLRALPVLNHALLDTTKANQSGSVPLHVTDLENPQAIQIKKMDGTYPVYERVIPKDEPVYTVAVNPAYLEKIGKAYKDFGATIGRQPAITLDLQASTSPYPIMITGKNEETGQTMTVGLMPTHAREYTGLNRSQVLRDYAESVEQRFAGFWERYR